MEKNKKQSNNADCRWTRIKDIILKIFFHFSLTSLKVCRITLHSIQFLAHLISWIARHLCCHHSLFSFYKFVNLNILLYILICFYMLNYLLKQCNEVEIRIVLELYRDIIETMYHKSQSCYRSKYFYIIVESLPNELTSTMAYTFLNIFWETLRKMFFLCLNLKEHVSLRFV